MDSYISHLHAAVRWNIPYLSPALGIREENLPGPSSVSATGITVTKHTKRFLEGGHKVRATELPLPRSAITLHGGEHIASPELVFLELANELPIHRLILFGLQLCAHPPGFPQDAVTSKQKIMTLLRATAGHAGHKRAMRAARYLENGSWSIMESIAFMMLTLPSALGGYGLSGAVFNHEIPLAAEGRRRLGQQRCFADIYYKKAKVAVEYQSLANHATATEQGRDMIRATVLALQGIEVLQMTTIQLFDEGACRDFAHHLAARTGKRIQLRSAQFQTQHNNLRALLTSLGNDEKE
jgi:hypothetical protein